MSKDDKHYIAKISKIQQILKILKGRVWMQKADTYSDPIILEFPNATVRVFRPILTDEERKRKCVKTSCFQHQTDKFLKICWLKPTILLYLCRKQTTNVWKDYLRNRVPK